MARFNLKRIDLFCPQYNTDATIRINETHQSGHAHLEIEYEKGGYDGRRVFAAGIPADWTDHDLADLILLPMEPRASRNWPAWEVPARDYGAAFQFRWWKGEKPE